MLKIKTFEFAYMGLLSVVVFSLRLTELYGPEAIFTQGFGHYHQSSILFQDNPPVLLVRDIKDALAYLASITNL